MLWVWFVIAVDECWWPMLISLRSFWTTMVSHLPLLFCLACLVWTDGVIWLQLWTSLNPAKKAYGITDDPDEVFCSMSSVTCQQFCFLFPSLNCLSSSRSSLCLFRSIELYRVLRGDCHTILLMLNTLFLSQWCKTPSVISKHHTVTQKKLRVRLVS